MLSTLAVSGYRSLRDFIVELGPLSVVTGPNGSGKSSLYRSLHLLADAAQGNLVGSLAREGGLRSTLWAGPDMPSRSVRRGEYALQRTVRRAPVHLRLGFASHDLSYAIDLGLPIPTRTAFTYDPEIKREVVFAGPVLRRGSVLVDRDGPLVTTMASGPGSDVVTSALSPFDSMMTHCADPRGTPELLVLRDRMRGWRFYDNLRTDRDAPARKPQVGTRTPVLAHDGGDLPAALQTLIEIGDVDAMQEAVDEAFPGSQVEIQVRGPIFELALKQPGLLRPLSATELSDGTLRFLLWVAALLSPHPPELLVVNEPERSLHVDLIPALARLIGRAAKRTQIIVVSHSKQLVTHLEESGDVVAVALEKTHGETVVSGQNLLQTPPWKWPTR